MWRHVAILASILAFATLLYAHVTTSYFCGYDDFLDVQRAEFVDQFQPSLILTTTHYGSFKYRPLQRVANLLSYLVAPGEAIGFRARNLFFHELCVVAIYCLGLILFDSWVVSAVAAFFFAVHPLANQPILQSVGGNPVANSLFLLSLILFFLSEKRRSSVLLCGSLLSGFVALYGYESSIVLPGIMVSWWGLTYLRTKRLPELRTLVVFAIVGGLLFGSYLVVRQHFTHGTRTPIYGPLVALKAFIQYSGALLLPVDVVLAHHWFGTPLPSQLDIRRFVTVFLPPVFLLGALIGFAGIKNKKAIAGLLPREEWYKLLFLLLASLLSIFPFLVFTDHVSETYITLPVAFYCLSLARLLALISWPTYKWIVIGTFAVLFCSATWVRNQQVAACASSAKQILSNLSSPLLLKGEWLVNLAKGPGQITPPRYGLYNYAGLDTLGTDPDYGLVAVESALQVATGNSKIKVHVFETHDLPGHCNHLAANEACYFVNSDTTVTQLK